MSVKETFLTASLMTKLALIIISVSNFLNWIAFTTTSWYVTPTKWWGIWRQCDFGSCYLLDGVISDWHGTFQAFAILGFMGINIAMVLIILFLFVNACKSNGEVKMAAIGICFVTALCYLIAVIIYGAEKSPTGSVSYSSFYSLGYYLGYSYGLAIVAFILEAVTGVLLLLDGKALSVTTSPA
ncbi:hypothetical protein C0Q70_18936 [Pomacea canaliculata]|uniref:MARVEL domain-containing protein n=1 Tax=Pomacea canaliculata TaxID=400727 RepID=A0A2T7NHZ3_POMCA|nr:uncharacterized protein LOC112553353 [Pomacea canaliculata]PVD20775.1 hypothetical protein C0Q70_18936 [Pomacea canaliculata]